MAACVGHGRGEFAKAKRTNQGNQSGGKPYHEQETRTLNLVRDVRRNNEYSGADHRPDDDHRRIEQAEAFYQIAGRPTGSESDGLLGVCHLHC